MSTQEITPSPEPNGGLPASPTEGVTAEASPSAPAVPAATETLRETIERVAKSKPRDDRGKFAPNVPRETVAATEVVAAPAPERPSMPKSYKKELEAHWGTLPTEFAAAVAQRETDYEKGVAPLKERAKVADEFLNAVKPYEAMIRAEGGSPVSAVQSLLQTAQVLRDPAQRVPAIASLMQQYQVSIEDLQQVLAGNGSTQTSLNPQYVSQLVKQELTSYQQHQSEQQNEAEVEQFAANPEHPHFAEVQDWMGPILSSDKFRAEHHGKPVQAKLKAAYDLAVRVDPAIWEKVQAQQQAATRATQQVTQAKNAAVQVKGAPHTGPAPKINPKDRRAYIASLVTARR